MTARSASSEADRRIELARIISSALLKRGAQRDPVALSNAAALVATKVGGSASDARRDIEAEIAWATRSRASRAAPIATTAERPTEPPATWLVTLREIVAALIEHEIADDVERQGFALDEFIGRTGWPVRIARLALEAEIRKSRLTPEELEIETAKLLMRICEAGLELAERAP